jgi:hypothetical protein
LVKIPFRGPERKGTETPPPDLVELDLSDAEIAEDQEGSNSEDEDFSPPEEDRKQRRKAGSDKKVTPGKVPKTPPRKTQATATANTPDRRNRKSTLKDERHQNFIDLVNEEILSETEVAPMKSGGSRAKQVAKKDMDMESNSKEDARGRGKCRQDRSLIANTGDGDSGSSAEPGYGNLGNGPWKTTSRSPNQSELIYGKIF